MLGQFNYSIISSLFSAYLGHFHVLSNEWEILCRYVLSNFFARNCLFVLYSPLVSFSKNSKCGEGHFPFCQDRKKKHFCFQVHQNKWENKFGLLSAPPPVCYLSCEADTFRHLLSLQSRNREGHFFPSCAIEACFFYFFYIIFFWLNAFELLNFIHS